MHTDAGLKTRVAGVADQECFLMLGRVKPSQVPQSTFLRQTLHLMHIINHVHLLKYRTILTKLMALELNVKLTLL